MVRHEASEGMIRATGTMGTHAGYMPGFGNDFETEALPGALPQGMNSPQRCRYGLYGEQLPAPPLPPIRPSGHGAIAFTPRSGIRRAIAASICPIGRRRRMSSTG